MKTRYHIELTKKTIGDHFAEGPLRIIICANVMQDKISNQFGHDYIHFDSSAFEQGFRYIEDQQNILIRSVSDESYTEAQKALGRILHTWQDFYSHSNYVRLWLEKNVNANPCDIVHNNQQIFNSPDLRSGKNYGVMEFAAMIPLISHIIRPMMPDDSHAQMNIDSPKSSPIFPYAFEAALKRTNAVYLDIIFQIRSRKIDDENILAFHGKSIG
jgi:hypothetical protein